MSRTIRACKEIKYIDKFKNVNWRKEITSEGRYHIQYINVKKDEHIYYRIYRIIKKDAALSDENWSYYKEKYK